VLGADVVVAERKRLAQRELEHLLGTRRERDLPGLDRVAPADDPRYLSAHVLERHVERLEHARRDPLLLAQKPEQDVLGADVVVLQRTRLVLRENDNLSRALSEALEHRDQDTPTVSAVADSVALPRCSPASAEAAR